MDRYGISMRRSPSTQAYVSVDRTHVIDGDPSIDTLVLAIHDGDAILDNVERPLALKPALDLIEDLLRLYLAEQAESCCGFDGYRRTAPLGLRHALHRRVHELPEGFCSLLWPALVRAESRLDSEEDLVLKRGQAGCFSRGCTVWQAVGELVHVDARPRAAGVNHERVLRLALALWQPAGASLSSTASRASRARLVRATAVCRFGFCGCVRVRGASADAERADLLLLPVLLRDEVRASRTITGRAGAGPASRALQHEQPDEEESSRNQGIALPWLEQARGTTADARGRVAAPSRACIV